MIKECHSLWSDSWKHFRKYAEKIPLTDQEWTEEVDEKAELVKKYDTGNCKRIAHRIMILIEDELEQLDKEAKL